MLFDALIWRAAEGSQPGGGRLLDHTAISLCMTFAARQDMWCEARADDVALTVICSGSDDAEMRPIVNRSTGPKSEWNSPTEDDGRSPGAGSMPGASGFGLCCRPWRWSRCCGLPPGLPGLIGSRPQRGSASRSCQGRLLSPGRGCNPPGRPSRRRRFRPRRRSRLCECANTRSLQV